MPTTLPTHDRMRHMIVGRLVHQHVMIFEPAFYTAHLQRLAALVGRSVLTPEGAGALVHNDAANLAVVRLAEAAELADGDWPDFSATLTERRVHGLRVVVGPDVPDGSVARLADAVSILAGAGLSAPAELVIGALVAKAPDIPAAVGDGALVQDRGAEGVEAQLAAVLAAVPRSWGSVDPAEWRAVAEAVAPVRVEDAFVAGCVAELVDRSPATAAHVPGLVRSTERTAELLRDAHDAVGELKKTSLLAELLLCWWPGGDRVKHLFTSELDYLTRHPASA